MAIRWDEFPHKEIGLKIYSRLGHHAAGRSVPDSLRHILQRRLATLDSEDHRRFIELEAPNLVEHLRCTRDMYQEFVEKHNCRPILEARWVVLRFAVFPTAIALLRGRVIEYAKLTRVRGADLSLLFGIVTRTCHQYVGDGIALLCAPDLSDETAATDSELQNLGDLVNETTLLWFRDIHDGGGVGHLLGGGPFAIDDAMAIRNSFGLCGLREGITMPAWYTLREEAWHLCSPWTEGLCSLFGAVQEELLSQWRALPSDSLLYEHNLGKQNTSPRSIIVPSIEPTDGAGKRRPGRKARLPQEFVVCAGTLWRKASSNNTTQVPDDQLQLIASALDAAGHLPPSAHLEGKYARELKDFNSRNSNSKTGPVKTWTQLVSLGDKDNVRGMRRLLSRCAKKLGESCLSGN
jgi:hypothetical protein